MREALMPVITEVLPVLLQAASAVLVCLVTWVGTKAARWIEAKTHSASFGCAMERITSVTKMLVLEAERTLVREAKRSSSGDTKMAAADGDRIRNEVVKRAREHIGARGLKELQGCLGHAGDDGYAMIERMLRTHVEARLAEMQERA